MKFFLLLLIEIVVFSYSYAQEQRNMLKYDIASIRDFRNMLLSDPYRPVFHFAIPEDYASPFDPNGCIYWNGRYHMFHIYQDKGTHVFAHLSSLDLIHWREHPKALYPTQESNIEGIFSGNCFINKEGVATMIYHGVGQGNSISFSNDPLLDQWRQLPSNPIIKDPKNRAPIANETNPQYTNVAPYASWDPHGWMEGDQYYAIFGGKRPAVFKATQLDQWNYVGDLFGAYLPNIANDEDVSCPDFFKLKDKHILLCISHNLGCRYYIGKWINEKFYPYSHGRMSFVDNTYFAPESLQTPDGRRIMWAWLFDARSQDIVRKSGWSGMMSMPRELFLNQDEKTLGMRPIKELRSLRYNECKYKSLKVCKEKILPGISGDVKELEVTVDPLQTSKVGVKFLMSDDSKEYGEVFYDVVNQKIVLDVSNLNAIKMAEMTPLGVKFSKIEEAPFKLGKNEKLKFNIFIDKCIIEVYVNERLALVRTNAFSSEKSRKKISLFSNGLALFKDIKAWDIMPTNFY